MPADRVLATQQAKDAANQMLALTGFVREQIRRVLQQGSVLADPTRWDGRLAGRWRNDWGPDATQLSQIMVKLNELEHRAQQVVEDIFKADSAPAGAGASASNVTPPMKQTTNTDQAIATITSIASNAIGTGLNAAQGMQGAASDLYKDAEDSRAFVQRMEQLALDPELTDAGRSAAARAGQAGAAAAAEAETQAAKIVKPLDKLKIPENLRNVIAASPGELIEDGSGLLKLTKGVLKGVPYVGTAVSIGFGILSVADGSERPVQAVAETGGSIAGGAVGAESGAEVGAAVGTFFGPGPGTVVGGIIGGIAGGLIGTLAGGKAGDDLAGTEHMEFKAIK